jgi:hypothetical protein
VRPRVHEEPWVAEFLHERSVARPRQRAASAWANERVKKRLTQLTRAFRRCSVGCRRQNHACSRRRNTACVPTRRASPGNATFPGQGVFLSCSFRDFFSNVLRGTWGNTADRGYIGIGSDLLIVRGNMVKMSVPGGGGGCPCVAAHGAPCLSRSGLCCCRTDRARRGCQSGMCRTMTQRSKPSRFRA